MKKIGLFGAWAWILGWMMLGVVADDGGGGDDVDFEIDLDELGGDDTPPANEPDKSTKEPDAPSQKKPDDIPADPQPTKAELDDDTKQTIEELREFKAAAENFAAIQSAAEEIKADHPDFDLDKVQAKLEEMAKENPDKAEQYNNPAGWEALHLKHFAKRTEEDGVFDPGRGNAEEPFDFDKTKQAALNGDKRAKMALFENAR